MKITRTMKRTFSLAIGLVMTSTIAMASLSGAVSKDTPSRLMTDLQNDYRIPAHVAAGIVGNFGTETDGFRAQEEYSNNRHGTKGYGIAMWTDPRKGAGRRTNLENFARRNGMNVDSYEAQYAYLKHELDGEYSKVMDRMRNAGSVEEATKIFMDGFEKPSAKYAHLDKRLAYAQQYLEGNFDYGYSGGGGGLDGTSEGINKFDSLLMNWG